VQAALVRLESGTLGGTTIPALILPGIPVIKA